VAKRGQLISRGEKKWLVRVYVGRDQQGKRQYSAKTVEGTANEARQELTKMLRDADTKMLVRRTTQTFSEYLEDWYKTKIDVTEQTLNGYKYLMKHHAVPAFGSLKLHEITPRVVQSFYSELKETKGLSPRTIRYTHAVLHQAFEWAVEPAKLLAMNPTARLKLPKKVKRPPTFLSPDQIASVLEKTRGDRLYPLWHLLLHTGLRPQEALALKWTDFEPTKSGAQVTIRRTLVNDGYGHFSVQDSTKTEGSKRTVSVSKSTWEVLQLQRRRQAEEMMLAGERYDRQDFVFANRFGRFLDRTNVAQRWKTATKKAGVTIKARFYDTRHSHATTLLNNGVDIALVSKRLGHKSIQTTLSHYAFLLPETDQKMAETMEQAVVTAAKKAAAQ
jgi:integrase